MLSERETAIQQNDGVDRLPLELCPVKNLYYVYQGTRSFANMPGNVALCRIPLISSQNVQA